MGGVAVTSMAGCLKPEKNTPVVDRVENALDIPFHRTSTGDLEIADFAHE
jgi:hypothetical protein